jgi:stage II sporulation protein R
MKNLLKNHSLSLSMLIGAVAAITVAGFTAFAQECERLPAGIFRLHILAESDSEQDQRLKYELRDYILSEFAEQLQDFDSVEAAVEKSRELLPEIQQKSQEFTNKSVYVEITEAYFPTRVYNSDGAPRSATLPAGTYTALKITIGEGRGENWWCVMFPALCLPAVTETQSVPVFNMPESVTDSPRVKFAVFEFLSSRFR